jgi:hypothetical protein
VTRAVRCTPQITKGRERDRENYEGRRESKKGE